MDNSNNIWPSVVGGLSGSVADTALSMLTGRSNMQAQADIQFNNWKKQFDLINEYNKPINQLRRSSEAGVNPFVNPSSAQSVGKLSSDASPSGVMPAFSPATGFGNTFSQLMQGLLTAQQAKGKGIENEKLSEFLSAQIRNQLSEAGLAEVNTAFQNMANEIYGQYGSIEKRAQIKNLFKDLAVKESQIALNSSETEYNYQHALESMAHEAHARALSVLGQKEIDAFDARFNKWLKLAESQITANRAGASRDTALARTENELRPERKRELIIENGLRAIGFETESEFSRSERQVLLDRSIEEAELAHKENKLYYYQFAVDVLKAVAQGAMSATFGYKLLKSTKAAKSAGKSANAAKSKDEFDNVLKSSEDFDKFYKAASPKDKKILDEFLYGSGLHRSN